LCINATEQTPGRNIIDQSLKHTRIISAPDRSTACSDTGYAPYLTV